ncbi:glycosyltransferase [Devosia sp. XJ19-1]|uniref:Glycosyltransferase n=1 Tax=Devosia ureilytica TaxID=2952754 RepID=A0A9Q4AQF4_9HYPH|nr:glycosyltransferase [Devosia ureilytica]MCP8884406.1 glycosyltransferase [Devosia ureilytica]MCP8888014.1 glycosyltransferase [Devosia ureilytica]
MAPADPGRSSSAPLVSVVMANYQAGDRIVAAMHAVLRQSMPNLELIVSDDASADDSLAHVRRLMREDGRVRLVTADDNGGPARARNRALDIARGRWIAIVDSDDLIHPERFERLLAAAEVWDADIIADDLLLFFEDGSAPRLLLGEDADAPFKVTAEQWIRSGTDATAALGYLKPLIRADSIGPLRYDEDLRIGEDHDLVLRLLLSGARMHVIPEPYYLYRRHSGSTSHRLSAADMQAMIDRQVALVQGPLDPRVLGAFSRRLRGLRQGLAYERLVESIKSRRVLDVITALAANPAHVGRLWRSFREGRQHRQALPPREVSPLFVLGAAGTTGASEVVPPYVPVALADWNAPRPRRIWRDLVARRGLGAIRCIPLDQAGRYAAGFIPEAEILPHHAAEDA